MQQTVIRQFYFFSLIGPLLALKKITIFFVRIFGAPVLFISETSLQGIKMASVRPISQKTVLVVDDELPIREYVADILRGSGSASLPARTPAKRWTRRKKNR